MPLIAVAFIIIFIVGYGLAYLSHPIWGIITYIVVYFNMPTMQWWRGYVPDIRWSMLSVFLCLGACLAHWDKLAPVKHLNISLNWLIIAICIMMGLTLPFANDFSVSYDWWLVFLKILIPFFLIQLSVITLKHYLLVISTLILSLTHIAYNAIFSFSGARLDNVGLIDANDANTLAAAVVLILPLALSLVITGRKIQRMIAICSIPFLVNLVAMTRSRGALLGMIIGGIYFIFIQPSWKKRLYALIFLSLFGGLSYSLMDNSYIDRFSMIFVGPESADEIANVSAGRTTIWSYVAPLMANYPFGMGGGGFQAASAAILPEELLNSQGVRVIHNTYLELLIENNAVSLILYLLLLYDFVRRVKQKEKLLNLWKAKTPSYESRICISQLLAFRVSLISYLVIICFLDRVYFELFYIFLAAGLALSQVKDSELTKTLVR